MAELVVIGFDDPHTADRALTELARLQREYLIDLEDAVVAVRDPDGRLRLKQSVDLVGAGAAFGTGAGALSGSLADYGIDDDFIRQIGQTLQPNSSALFVLVRKAQPEKVLAEVSHFRGRVIRSSLSPEQEARLQAALSGSGVTMPGSAGSTPSSGVDSPKPHGDPLLGA